MKAGRSRDGDDVRARLRQHLVKGRVPGRASALRRGPGALFHDVADRAYIQTFDLRYGIEVISTNAAAADDRDAIGFRAHFAPNRLIPSPSAAYWVPHLPQVPAPESGSRSPHWHIQPIRRARTPTTSAYGW